MLKLKLLFIEMIYIPTQCAISWMMVFILQNINWLADCCYALMLICWLKYSQYDPSIHPPLYMIADDKKFLLVDCWELLMVFWMHLIEYNLLFLFLGCWYLQHIYLCYNVVFFCSFRPPSPLWTQLKHLIYWYHESRESSFLFKWITIDSIRGRMK